jgi:hypothetical protein
VRFGGGDPNTVWKVKRYRRATRSSIGGSVTLAASPSRTRSMPSSPTEKVQAGFAARLRALRVPGPLVK